MSEFVVGCPYCGASSGEPCIDQQTSEDAAVPHDERVAFAARVAPGRVMHFRLEDGA